uniref:Pco130820 n=1 Tax=Arundo donax TaxID=35708 RepID=A0A0A9DZV6_ARUDO
MENRCRTGVGNPILNCRICPRIKRMAFISWAGRKKQHGGN